MSRYTYSLMAEVDLDFLPSVKGMIDSVNKCMEGFGFHEKMGLRSNTEVAKISANRLLMPEEKSTIIRLAQQSYDEQELLKGKFRLTGMELVTR